MQVGNGEKTLKTLVNHARLFKQKRSFTTSWTPITANSHSPSPAQNSNLTELTISGTGVLKIEPDCIAYCRNKILLIKSNPKIAINNVNPKFNIIDDECCNLRKISKLSLNMSYNKICKINLDNLKSLKHLSDHTIEQLKTIRTSAPAFNNNVCFSIFSVLSIILCVSFMF